MFSNTLVYKFEGQQLLLEWPVELTSGVLLVSFSFCY